ncbi:hypothetical protein Droror1_Dr00028293 [Drosera rotundifolia]
MSYEKETYEGSHSILYMVGMGWWHDKRSKAKLLPRPVPSLNLLLAHLPLFNGDFPGASHVIRAVCLSFRDPSILLMLHREQELFQKAVLSVRRQMVALCNEFENLSLDDCGISSSSRISLSPIRLRRKFWRSLCH